MEAIDAADQIDGGVDLGSARRHAFDIAADGEALCRGELEHLGVGLDGQLDRARQHVVGRQEIALHERGDVHSQPLEEIERLRRTARAQREDERGHARTFGLRAHA